jgi:hypothetical protein
VRGARHALLLALALLFLFFLADPAAAPTVRGRFVVVLLLDDVSVEEAIGSPPVRSVARGGGFGLLTPTEEAATVRGRLRKLAREDPRIRAIPTSLPELEDDLFGATFELDNPLILVVGLTPSPAMERDGDDVMPVAMAGGKRAGFPRPHGPLRGITSDTTGRPGLVSNVDLVPTILEFLGEPIPEDVAGNPIRVEGEPPTELHRRYLEYRRVVTPVGLTVLGLALGALAAGVVVILSPWRPPAAVVRGIAVIGLFAVSLQVAMLAGSWLPDFSWPVVLGTLVGVGGVVTAAAVWAGRRSPYAAVATVAGAGVVLIVVDWLLGWRSLLTPLLGGSALEGTRFYGLGNSYAGLLLAGAVLVAALLRPWAGVALLLAAAVFAGSPWAGADLGGGITLFGAAGIWWALGVRRRAGLTELAVVGTAVVGGAGILILLHRLAAEPSHVSRAVDRAGGIGGILGVFLDRLALNLETTARTPAVWLALAAVPVAIWVAWRRPGPFGPALEGHQAWGEATLALGLSAALGYVLNDTYGLTAVAFVYLALTLVYPVLDRKNVRSKRKKVVNKQARGVDSRPQFG